MNNFRIPTFRTNYVFNKEDALRQEQERLTLENERKGLQYNPNTGTWSKPVAKTPQPRPDSYWNTIASQYGFKDMQAVKDWQSKNGLVADGKFGKNSLAKWNTLQNTPKQSNTTPKQSTKPVKPQATPISSKKPTNTNSAPSRTNPTSKGNSIQATISRYSANNTIGGDFGINRFLRTAASNIGDFLTNLWNTRESSARPLSMGYGRTTAYQQGGKLGDLQKEFVAYLIQVSGSQSEQDLNDFIQSLGEEGLKQQYQQFMQTMQNGTPSAKNGAKLNYIRSLRGVCPEGYELGYFKEGGQICPKCMKKREKMGAIPFKPIQGEKGTKVVQDFKKDLKNKKDKISISKKAPEKKEQGGTLNINEDLLELFKCGGKSKKMKKKENGGLVQKNSRIPIKEKFIDKDKCGKKMKKK